MPRRTGSVRLRARRGNALILVTVLLGALGVSLAAMAISQSLLLKTLTATRALDAMDVAAEGVANVLVERLAAKAQAKLGNVTQADLNELTAAIDSLGNGTLGPVPLPTGVQLQSSRSGYRFTLIDSGRVVPDVVHPLVVTPDDPYSSWFSTRRLAGVRTQRTLEVEVTAAVSGLRDFTRVATARVAIARVPEHPWAIYENTNAYWCWLNTQQIQIISGPIWTEGSYVSCTSGARYIAGSITALTDIIGTENFRVTVPEQFVLNASFASGGRMLTDRWWGNTAGLMAETRGRVRSMAGMAGNSLTGLIPGNAHAGSGECPSWTSTGADPCNGTMRWTPSATLQHTAAAGTDASVTVTCGVAYPGCAPLPAGAVTYVPWPFSGVIDMSQAQPDPTRPNRWWHGLFPDPLRETYCTASYGGAAPGTYRTFQCPTNHFGIVIDLSLLPAIPGGFLAVLPWKTPSGSLPAGVEPNFQEVLYLKNAAFLAGPLTIHTPLPVVIEGNYNTVNPKPAMIDARRISVLPVNAARQLQRAIVWDSSNAVMPYRQMNLIAMDPVKIRAVLRAQYTPFTSVGDDHGGVILGIPRTIGDWQSTVLTTEGALEARNEPAVAAPGTFYGNYRGIDAASPSGWPTVIPAVRRVVYDTLLWTTNGTPPGSWRPEHFAGSPAPRTQARQQNAHGGTTLVWVSQYPVLGTPRTF